MGNHLSARALTIVGALSMLGPRVALAAPPPPPRLEQGDPEPVHLEFDAAILDQDHGARLRKQLFDVLDPIFERAGLARTEAGGHELRTVHIRVISFEPDRRDYVVALKLTGDDHQPALPDLECKPCSEARLVARIAGATSRLLSLSDELAEFAAREPDEPEPPPVEADELEERPRAPLGSKGISGAVLIGVGLGGIAAGSYLVHRDSVALDPPGVPYPRVRDLVPAGAATLGGGALVTAIGATLLALERGVRERSFGFHLTPTYVGFEIQQRF